MIYGIKISDEKVKDTRKLIDFLRNREYMFGYNYLDTSSIVMHSYMTIEPEYKISHIHMFDDFENFDIFHISKKNNYIITKMITIDKFFKKEFKKTFDKNTRIKHHLLN